MSSELPTELQAWLTGLRLSQPLRSIRQTFSNGRLVAEILDKYGALGVSLEASFGSYGSLEKKRSNWELLEKQFKVRGKGLGVLLGVRAKKLHFTKQPRRSLPKF